MSHRVVITGLGIVSSIGIGKEEFWKSCLQGISGVKPIRGFDVSLHRSRLGAQLPDIDFKAFIKPAKGDKFLWLVIPIGQRSNIKKR